MLPRFMVADPRAPGVAAPSFWGFGNQHDCWARPKFIIVIDGGKHSLLVVADARSKDAVRPRSGVLTGRRVDVPIHLRRAHYATSHPATARGGGGNPCCRVRGLRRGL